MLIRVPMYLGSYVLGSAFTNPRDILPENQRESCLCRFKEPGYRPGVDVYCQPFEGEWATGEPDNRLVPSRDGPPATEDCVALVLDDDVTVTYDSDPWTPGLADEECGNTASPTRRAVAIDGCPCVSATLADGVVVPAACQAAPLRRSGFPHVAGIGWCFVAALNTSHARAIGERAAFSVHAFRKHGLWSGDVPFEPAVTCGGALNVASEPSGEALSAPLTLLDDARQMAYLASWCTDSNAQLRAVVAETVTAQEAAVLGYHLKGEQEYVQQE